LSSLGRLALARLASRLRASLRGSEVVLRVLHCLLGDEGPDVPETLETLAREKRARTGVCPRYTQCSSRSARAASKQQDQRGGACAGRKRREGACAAHHRGSSTRLSDFRRHLAPREVNLLAGKDDGLLRNGLYQFVERAIAQPVDC
jgi:hypothetical protein